MHHALAVDFVQCVGNLDAVLKRLIHWQSALHQAVGQRLTFDVLHDDEVDPIVLTDVVERADVRMIQLRDRSGLTLEPLSSPGVFCEMLGQHLDGHRPAEAGVLGLVDFTHAASPDAGDESVVAKVGPGG